MVTTHEPQYLSVEITEALASHILDQLITWGLTADQAIGVLAIVYQAIKKGELDARKVTQ